MRRHRKYLATTFAALSIFVAACAAQPAVTTAPQAAPTSVAVVATPVVSTTSPVVAAPATATAVATPTSASVASADAASANATATGTSATPAATTAGSTTTSATSATTSATRYDVASGSKATYQVREQLVRLNAPSDAIGTTSAVTGAIVIGADGKVDSSQSKLVVDLTSLQSDSSMRDHFIQGSTLDTAQYPTATFVPTAITGLTTPLPTSGQQTFKLVGNLTVHGVTKPVTFDVTTQANGNTVTGQATTTLTFEDFGMSPPKAGAVLSVNDSIKLAVTLNLTKAA
jgi:polyisoprenoid-binding protein YceI